MILLNPTWNMKMKKPSTSNKKPLVEAKVEDPIASRLDKIIELLVAIKCDVDTIRAKVNTIDNKVQKPFDIARLVKD